GNASPTRYQYRAVWRHLDRIDAIAAQVLALVHREFFDISKTSLFLIKIEQSPRTGSDPYPAIGCFSDRFDVTLMHQLLPLPRPPQMQLAACDGVEHFQAFIQACDPQTPLAVH